MVVETYAVKMIAPPFYTETDCSRVKERLYSACVFMRLFSAPSENAGIPHTMPLQFLFI